MKDDDVTSVAVRRHIELVEDLQVMLDREAAVAFALAAYERQHTVMTMLAAADEEKALVSLHGSLIAQWWKWCAHPDTPTPGLDGLVTDSEEIPALSTLRERLWFWGSGAAANLFRDLAAGDFHACKYSVFWNWDMINALKGVATDETVSDLSRREIVRQEAELLILASGYSAATRRQLRDAVPDQALLSTEPLDR